MRERGAIFEKFGYCSSGSTYINCGDDHYIRATDSMHEVHNLWYGTETIDSHYSGYARSLRNFDLAMNHEKNIDVVR